MRRPIAAPLLAVLASALLAVPALAQWKWVDSAGHVQYSDLPPPAGVPEKDILQRPNAVQRRTAAAPAPASAASGALVPKPVDSELEAKRKKTEQDEEARKKAQQKAEEAKVAAARADNCTRARAQLRTLDSGVRVARINEQGEREVLDDAGRAQEAQRARDIVASDCK
ncbi:MAG: DUF4124 domain-containing protein [Proteobacteria bacterium]|nr:DUF4124 domain-containing protein [Pseudomonadota bacterium]